MALATLEHVNVTVSDPAKTADWMNHVFGWKIRWQGDSIDGGHTIHVGNSADYIAIYKGKTSKPASGSSYVNVGGLNHIAVVVDDIAAAERRVLAAGFTPGEHYDYEPGERFYFHDFDGIEYEVVCYEKDA